MIDRVQHDRVIEAGRLHDHGARAEGHDPDPDPGWLLADEVLGCNLRGTDAGRLDVGGGHAVGDVDSEDHRCFAPWRLDRRHRSGGSDDEEGERDQEQRERQVQAPSPPPRKARREEALGGEGGRSLPSFAPGQHIGDNNDWEEQQPEEPSRRDEGHPRRLRPLSAIRTKALTRSSSVDTTWRTPRAWATPCRIAASCSSVTASRRPRS